MTSPSPARHESSPSGENPGAAVEVPTRENARFDTEHWRGVLIQANHEEEARLENEIQSLRARLNQLVEENRVLMDSHYSDETNNERLRLARQQVQDEFAANEARREEMLAIANVERLEDELARHVASLVASLVASAPTEESDDDTEAL
mmetsp:Transcript_42290/g.102195  ORF Transcript_42290/g.102195 Transcript_42290/m.102195 type:complete len:149 (-) Transcript_42290:2403-2849(-)|eukprot:CAMPEP_0113629460 /NCGR_PEP_ID=MMETSP0017_2-20120614/15292_1 /TAXON_ID=2856 /ORGANISM="Cylindrotheca closterium" /LENGTH=148 /DNA_ID=CAMNT_0000539857 /DNA_START=202 /DNA_END=648 /DNA_ORIENTATION=+ /assembly_acc=CAM_ASM_000147